MDAELLDLQRQFESAQQAKSSIRLSDRNVVELVTKLQHLRILDFDLLHTVSGKEYITPDQLRREIEAEVSKRGRISLIELSDVVGVDLYYVEKQAERVVGEGVGLRLLQGEIVSEGYWDGVAEEVNERLQECSQIALAEIAAQWHVGSELVVSVLEPRIGTIIKGRLEGGQLYTPAYVSRISGMVRGAARGITVPTNLPIVWSSLQQILQDMDGANGVSVEGNFFQSIFNGLVKDGEVLGSLRAGVQWTPAVFVHAQRESVDSFFSQNSYISYDVLRKLAIPQPKQYLQSRYPEGIALEGLFIHPSLVEMLDAAVEDAVEHGNWIDSLSVLPAYVGVQDISKILSLCPSVQRLIKSSKAILLGETCIFSTSFVKHMFDQIEKELDTLSYGNSGGHEMPLVDSAKEVKVQPSSGQYPELKETADEGGGTMYPSKKGSGRKKGKNVGSSKSGTAENDSDNQEIIPAKLKKNQRKSKDSTSQTAPGTRHNAKKGSGQPKEDNINTISDEWVIQKILTIAPDLEELGGHQEPSELLRHLSSQLRPMLIDTLKKRRNTLLLENAERRRRLIDSLQRQLDEAFLEMQLYEKALDLFEDDPPTSVILHKHLLRTMGTPIVDKLLQTLDIDNKLKNGVEVDDSQTLESSPLNPVERVSLAKGLSGLQSVKSQAVVEALEGKLVDTFTTALTSVADESGLHLKKLDKKLERALLHSYRKDITSQVSSETDPVVLLSKVVSLLYLQTYNKALQAPGRAVSAVISRLKDKVQDPVYNILTDCHSAVVSLLASQFGSQHEGDGITDRSNRELLESKMPELKGLVLQTSSS